MTRPTGSWLTSLLLVAIMLAPWQLVVPARGSDPMVLIIAASTAVSNLDAATLRRAYEGYPVDYASGKRLIPFNAPSGTPARVRFDRALLGLEPDEMARFWVDQRIRGISQQPRTVTPEALAVRVVASLPGAVAYVSPAAVNATVRVVTIDGKGRDDGGYLLALSAPQAFEKPFFSATRRSSSGDGLVHFSPTIALYSLMRASAFSRPTSFSAQNIGPPR